jgi:hypothetical protein
MAPHSNKMATSTLSQSCLVYYQQPVGREFKGRNLFCNETLPPNPILRPNENKIRSALISKTVIDQPVRFDHDRLMIKSIDRSMPGYKGFIPAKKSENIYGKTFKETVNISNSF